MYFFLIQLIYQLVLTGFYRLKKALIFLSVFPDLTATVPLPLLHGSAPQLSRSFYFLVKILLRPAAVDRDRFDLA